MNEQQANQMYKWMYLCREFDKKAIWLQRTGRLGTFPSSLHQEAIFTAAAMALDTQDVYIPYYRDHAALLARGVSVFELLSYWGGYESGSNFKRSHDFPVCVPIATQFPHAAGVSLAFKLQNKNNIVLCSSGDGATSKGDFYETLNFAKIHQLKIIFLINNNQWAISVPLKEQSATQSLCQKAQAFDIPSMQVNGYNPDELFDAFKKAKETVKNGPIVIETMSYRTCDHTTSDDAHRYQPEKERVQALKNDPLTNLKYLIHHQELKVDYDAIHYEAETVIKNDIEKFLTLTPPTFKDMHKHLYAKEQEII